MLRTLTTLSSPLARPILLALLPTLASAASGQDCFTTQYASNNGGAFGGAVFFALDVHEPIRIQSFDCNLNNAGGDIGVEVWLSASIRLANGTSSPDSWTLVSENDGPVAWAGVDQPTRIELDRPIDLFADQWTLAIVVDNAAHRYTNLPQATTTLPHGPFDWIGGTAQNFPFGTQHVPSRMWNGTICYERLFGVVGTSNSGNGIVEHMESGFFDVETDRPIRIEAFDLLASDHFSSVVELVVLARPGSYIGHTNSATGWEQVGTVSGVPCQGLEAPTRFELPVGIDLPAGTTGLQLVPNLTRFKIGPTFDLGSEFTDGVVTLRLGAVTSGLALHDDFALCGAVVYSEIPTSVETLFAADNGGPPGGAVYFDLASAGPIALESIDVNVAAPGQPITLELYLTPGGWAGRESSLSAWDLVATGTGTSVGADAPSRVTLDERVHLPAGDFGVAVVVDGAGHLYTNGTPAIRSATDGTVTLDLGAATGTPFAGGVIADRIWNGALHYVPQFEVGSRYCDPAVPNSTGRPATIAALGKTNVYRDELVLAASDLPPNAFGYFLVAPFEGLVPNAGGSQGTLCLGGSIGRYVDSIFDSGSTGIASLQVDLDALPTPTGPRSVLSGELWRFQAWYRDANPTVTSNLTDAITVRFDG